MEWKQVWDRSGAEITWISGDVTSKQSRGTECESGGPGEGTSLPHTDPPMPPQSQLPRQESSGISAVLTATGSLSPPPCLASRLFSVPAPSWLLSFRLCLAVLNHNLFLHPKAPFAPRGTEAELPHHSMSCPRPAVWESAQPTCLLPPKERNEMQSMRGRNQNKLKQQQQRSTVFMC